MTENTAEKITAIRCKSCGRPITIRHEHFHCTRCATTILDMAFSPRSKKESLRKLRKNAYGFLILFMMLFTISRYFGSNALYCSMFAMFIGQTFSVISEKLSRIF